MVLTTALDTVFSVSAGTRPEPELRHRQLLPSFGAGVTWSRTQKPNRWFRSSPHCHQSLIQTKIINSTTFFITTINQTLQLSRSKHSAFFSLTKYFSLCTLKREYCGFLSGTRKTTAVRPDVKPGPVELFYVTLLAETDANFPQ